MLILSAPLLAIGWLLPFAAEPPMRAVSVGLPRSTLHRLLPPRLDGSDCSEDASAFIRETNMEHMEELRQVARVKGSEDGVDWNTEELASVELVAVDPTGLHLQEVLCSATDQRCIAVHVPIPWPAGMPIAQLPTMRKAFSELSRRAYAAALEDANMPVCLPPKYMAQQQELNSLMLLMNTEFGRLLKFYAIKHASEALSPTEQVERATVTQLTFEGLSLELNTVDVTGYSLDFDMKTRRKVWSTSVLFERPCNNADEVECRLIEMFQSNQPAPNHDSQCPQPINNSST